MGPSNEWMQALKEDLTGQVTEAISREEFYCKWGVHFLPSLMSAHLSQTCNNFKDPGVQFYGSDLFNDLRDQADEIFLRLPPPRPTARPPPVTPAVSRTVVTQAAAPRSPVSMAAYYNRCSG